MRESFVVLLYIVAWFISLGLVVWSFLAGNSSGTGYERLSDFSSFATVRELSQSFSAIKTGVVLSPSVVEITSESKGKVSSVDVLLGDYVKVGQPLAHIADVFYLYTFDLDLATTAYESAQSEYLSYQQQGESIIQQLKTDIFSLEQRISHGEQELLDISRWTDDILFQKQQMAFSEYSKYLTSFETLLHTFSGLVENIHGEQYSFFSSYVYLPSAFYDFRGALLDASSFLGLCIRFQDLLNQLLDCCYLFSSAGVEDTTLEKLLQDLSRLQGQFQYFISDFSPFFSDSFEQYQQQRIVQISQEISGLEQELTQKNLDFTVFQSDYQNHLSSLDVRLQEARSTYNHMYTQVNKLIVKSPREGFLRSYAVQNGDFVEVGDVIAFLDVDVSHSFLRVDLPFEEFSVLSGVHEVLVDMFSFSGGFQTITGEIFERFPGVTSGGISSLTVQIPTKSVNEGQVLSVSFPFDTFVSSIFLPESVFTSFSGNVGTVYENLSGEIGELSFPLGLYWNGYREVLTGIDETLQLGVK